MIGEIFILIFVIIGVLFNALGSIGIIRFPDVYTRLHAGTKCTTFGTIFIVAAVVTYGIWKYLPSRDPVWIVLIIHSVAALIFLLLANPTGAHAIAKAARFGGVRPTKAVVDEMEEVVRKGGAKE